MLRPSFVLFASAITALACAWVVLPLPAKNIVAVPPPATAPTSRPAWPAIPEATLQEIYRRELGPRYDPADAGKLYAAHQLIERYFEAAKADERKAVVAQIEATGLDANIVGRLTRLRMYWPALDGGAVYYVNEQFGPHVVRYFFGVPKDYDRAKPWPLVVKLPAANAFLTEPPPDADAVVDLYSGWIKDELEHHPDAVVLMPLLNLDELYGPSYAGMNSVIQPVLHVAGRVNVDPARVDLIGHSMAAHAAWNLALHYPTYFAAINPLAGAASQDWQRLRLMNLRNVLPVVWHDADDEVIKVDSSRSIVRALRGLKLDVEYEETKGVGHAPSSAVAARAYDKVRGRVRSLYPPQVLLQSNRPETTFNRADWLQVWQEITPGPERRLLFRHGSGHMTVYQNAYKVEATRDGNWIELVTDNVESLRLYLNDQMIDFREPVTIVLNHKPKFDVMVKPSVEEMLKDQLFLGRGWRYFTGVIDVDVIPPPPPMTRPTSRPTTGPTTRKGTITVGPGIEG